MLLLCLQSTSTGDLAKHIGATALRLKYVAVVSPAVCARITAWAKAGAFTSALCNSREHGLTDSDVRRQPWKMAEYAIALVPRIQELLVRLVFTFAESNSKTLQRSRDPFPILFPRRREQNKEKSSLFLSFTFFSGNTLGAQGERVSTLGMSEPWSHVRGVGVELTARPSNKPPFLRFSL